MSNDGQQEKLRGNECFKKGQFVEAIGWYTKAIQKSPHDTIFYLNRSQCYFKLNKFQDAINDATKAINLDASNGKAYFRRAMANKALVRLDEAQQDLQNALDIDPRNQEIQAEIKQVELLRQAVEREETIKKEPWARLSSPSPSTENSPSASRISRESLQSAISSVDDDSFLKPVSTRRLEPQSATVSTAKPSFAAAKVAREARLVGVEPKVSKQSVNGSAPNGQTTRQQQRGKDDVAQTILPSSPQPVKTAFDLINQWRNTRNQHAQFWITLKSLDAVNLPTLLQNSLEPDLLKDMVSTCFETFQTSSSDQAQAQSILCNLTRVPRFDFLAMFLDQEEKSKAQQVVKDTPQLAAWS